MDDIHDLIRYSTNGFCMIIKVEKIGVVEMGKVYEQACASNLTLSLSTSTLGLDDLHRQTSYKSTASAFGSVVLMVSGSQRIQICTTTVSKFRGRRGWPSSRETYSR